MVLDNIGHPITLGELVDLVNMVAEGVQIQTISIDDKHYVQASQLVTFQPDIIAGHESQLLLHRLIRRNPKASSGATEITASEYD